MQLSSFVLGLTPSDQFPTFLRSRSTPVRSPMGAGGRSLEGEEYKKALDEYKKGDDARILGFLMRHKDCHLA